MRLMHCVHWWSDWEELSDHDGSYQWNMSQYYILNTARVLDTWAGWEKRIWHVEIAVMIDTERFLQARWRGSDWTGHLLNEVDVDNDH